MKESEAKEKWCPHMRFIPGMLNKEKQMTFAPAAGAFNAVMTPSEGHMVGKCIASGCMMWEKSGILLGNGDQAGDCGLKRRA